MFDFFGEYILLTIIFILYSISAIFYFLISKNTKFLVGYGMMLSFFLAFFYINYLYRTRRMRMYDFECKTPICETKYNKKY